MKIPKTRDSDAFCVESDDDENQRSDAGVVQGVIDPRLDKE